MMGIQDINKDTFELWRKDESHYPKESHNFCTKESCKWLHENFIKFFDWLKFFSKLFSEDYGGDEKKMAFMTGIHQNEANSLIWVRYFIIF